MLAALSTTLLFSLSAVAANRTSRILGGTRANFYRLLLATALLAILASTTCVGMRGPVRGLFFISGIIGFGVGDLALYQALPRIGSRLSVMLVHCLAAPFAASVEWLWLGTRVQLDEALCSGIIILGVALAIAPKEHLHLPRKTLIIGVTLGILAALGQALGAVISRKAFAVADAAHFKIDGVSAAYQRIWGGVLISSLSMAWLKWFNSQPQPKPRWREVTPWLILNAAAGPAIGVAAYQRALATTPTAIVLPIVALTPLIIIPFSWHIEGERPTIRSLAGGIIAVAGVVGLTFARMT